ncbi:MAG: pyrroline-5-carboxylate reductase [Saprospiraceae bacterium]|nr:pyrroline-5-carboxylate reductase [Saprospiraceae bacterium]
MNKTIALIGCGNLGLSIVEGLLDAPGISPQIIATRRNLKAIAHLADRGVTVTSDNKLAARQADLIILAVKPYNVDKVLAEIAEAIDHEHDILVSAATGVTIEAMRKLTGPTLSIFRAMPNTATHVNESITCLCHDNANEEEVALVTQLFDSIGSTLMIDEHLMEAATILGACGIAYALRFIRAMIQGGIQIGFSAESATRIASQTVKGAAELLVQRNEHPEQEIDKVTTPKGCTIVGLNEMEHAGFSSSLIKGIVASYNKIAD